MTEPESITCPRCKRTSFNANDVRHLYCGACAMFLAQCVACGKVLQAIESWNVCMADGTYRVHCLSCKQAHEAKSGCKP